MNWMEYLSGVRKILIWDVDDTEAEEILYIFRRYPNNISTLIAVLKTRYSIFGV